ncbi:unnamed protein product [[Candida] boidinii]|nr:unnamed protein product [[Candida] boidinii]
MLLEVLFLWQGAPVPVWIYGQFDLQHCQIEAGTTYRAWADTLYLWGQHRLVMESVLGQKFRPAGNLKAALSQDPPCLSVWKRNTVMGKVACIL